MFIKTDCVYNMLGYKPYYEACKIQLWEFDICKEKAGILAMPL